ncbi:MAG: hypothetical protein FWE30_07315 [Bacteroidales bacterium]|nr:hypothetical protein [Bacteroidales bacterium]MCL2739240.1 hypothetical protein [Bacteroidales bacterium]
MMKNKLYSKLCCLAFFAWGIGLVGCNKTYAPPDIVGTWGKPEFYFMMVPNPNAIIDEYGLQEAVTGKINTRLQGNTFWDDFRPLLNLYEDYPVTLSLNPDNTFSFTYVSNRILTGTYEQDMNIITFFDSATPPGLIYGEYTDHDALLWLHLFNKTQETKEPFYYAVMGLFDLNEKEQEAYEVMIAGYQIGMGYKRTH